MCHGGARQRADEYHAAGQHGYPLPPAVPGRYPEGQFQQASEQQRNRREQADLAIAQRQVMPDERERRSLGAVDQLVDELDGACRSEQRHPGQRWPVGPGRPCA